MGDNSAIEWTDATWNPVTGCTKISRGCDNCYAERFSERFRGVAGHPFENGFDLTLRPERLNQPLAWKRPRTIFVNSMSDLFHKDVPLTFIDQVFDTMERAAGTSSRCSQSEARCCAVISSPATGLEKHRCMSGVEFQSKTRGRSPALRICAQPRHRSGSFPSNRFLDIWDGSISLASIG
jgi:hypothetical protein